MSAAPTVLVTGAGGFVGRQVVAALRSRGDDVVAIEHRWRDIDEVSRALAGRIPASCVHLGWYARPSDYLTSVEGNRRSLDASVDLVALLGRAGCEHLVVAGTCAEYGPGDADLVETDPIAPWSVYGAAKASFHLLLDSSLRPDGLTVAWARLFNLTGPGEDRDRLLPMVTRSFLAGRAVDLSDGEQVRDFLDVSDVASALASLAGRRAEGTFNVCSGTGTSLRSLIGAIAARLDASDLARFGARPRGLHDHDRVVGDSRRLRATGWSPTHDLDGTISRLVDHWTSVEHRAPTPEGV